jgi:hypothetical protein
MKCYKYNINGKTIRSNDLSYEDLVYLISDFYKKNDRIPTKNKDFVFKNIGVKQ